MTDEALMIALKNGDLDKATELFNRYHVKLYNFFLRLCWDKELSHDLTQNVFERMLKYRSTYNDKGTFKSWIYQIARNVNANNYHKNKMTVDRFADLEQSGGLQASAHDSLEEIETERTLQRSLAKLPDDMREVLILSRYEGLKYDEIAKITGQSEGAVKVMAHRAIKKLKENFFALEEA